MDEILLSRLLDLTVEIQQIPAPTFAETARGLHVQQLFEAEGLSGVSRDPLGNVYGCLPGGAGRPVLVSAHLDTVFDADFPLQVSNGKGRIIGPGIGDNALGVAALLGLVWWLKHNSVGLPGDLWLVANVGEEGLGNLCGMRAVVERFHEQPRAYLVIEGLALGQVYHRALGSYRYRISVRTSGGHSWVDHGEPSAIHETALLINRILSIPLPHIPRTTLNIGKIQGGTSINTIAAEAILEIDLRSEDARFLEELARNVEELALNARRSGVQVEINLIGRRPSGELEQNHPLVDLASTCLRQEGFQPNLNIGSTDANLPLSLGLPAVCVGITTGGGAHTLEEFINTAPVAQGMNNLIALTRGAYAFP